MFAKEVISTEFAWEQLVSGNTIAREVINGLSQRPMQIAPKYFYDQNGSELFDAITRLDEYYIARVERAILVDNCAAISAGIGSGRALIEPGAGSCEKVKWLLPDLDPAVYVPMDNNSELGRIEMYLCCKRDHQVTLGGKELRFAAGEMVHTENSYK